MINLEHRAMAKAVAAGEVTECPEAQFRKAYMYGLIARSLSGFVMPKPDVVKNHKPLSVHDVAGLLKIGLVAECDRALETDRALLAQMDEVVSQRMHRTNRIIRAEPAKKLLHAGVSTAIETETATLATVQIRSVQGDMTMPALLQSQRIPFAFAMQPLAALDLYDTKLFDFVWLPDIGSTDHSDVFANTRIFLPEAVETTPKGLVLATALPEEEVHKDHVGEPHIGCPVTLIKGFVRDLHAVAAEACVQAGVIQVAEG